MGENIYMLPSDMNLKIRSGTVGYNNKILVSDEKFSLGKMIRLTHICGAGCKHQRGLRAYNEKP